MTQREQTPTRPLPRCPRDHKPRYMFDARRVESKGGHFIQCRCSCTPKCTTFDVAWAHWHKMHGIFPVSRIQPTSTALPQLQLRLVGGVER